MAESTLSLRVSDIQAKLGRFAGWSSDSSSWTEEQTDIINDATSSGLRRFYFPVPADPMMAGYEWSFLKPLVEINFPANVQTVQLPDDYTAMSGTRITLAPSGTTAQPYLIQWVNEAKIRELYSISPTLTGPPMYVSLLSIQGTSVNAGQRFELYFFPAADQAYTLQMTVSIAPNALDGSSPFAYGGTAHAETILESCLAIMEERLDDMPAGQGPHSIAFQTRLAASIVMDRRNKPPRIGRNSDRSDEQAYGYPNPWWHLASPPATYNGGGLC